MYRDLMHGVMEFKRWASQIFVSSTQASAVWEEGIPAEEMPPSDWPVGKHMGIFRINNDWHGRVQLTVGSVTSGQVALSALKKKTIEKPWVASQ